MKIRLSELERLRSFALLGPGYCREPFLLLKDLRATAHADVMLVFASFEDPGPQALTVTGDDVQFCDVIFDVHPREVSVDMDANCHALQVRQIREAIARGDVYQVCLTVRARLENASGAELFALMCEKAAARFAAWVRLEDGREFVSASPELFFEINGREVRTEPMKGTARADALAELYSSEKDQCELSMITDLLRNDLAQVCRPKTVRVLNERRVLELPYALQTVSDIAGTLEDNVSPLDVLHALHPGGSVTGAPKQAALAMIRELETSPRGAYCGALGLCTADRAVFSLLIRTATRASYGWELGVGGGIVWDSDAQSELEELYIKAGAIGARLRQPAD